MKKLNFLFLAFSFAACTVDKRVDRYQMIDSSIPVEAVVDFDKAQDKASTLIDASSHSNTLIKASSESALAGSSIIISPGALQISASIVMELAEPLAESSLFQEVAIPDDLKIENTGSGIIIRPSEQVDLKIPLQISMPLPTTTGLKLADKSYAVYFKYIEPGTQKLITGILPADEKHASIKVDTASGLTVVQFKAYFGAYWVVQISRPFLPAEVPTAVESQEPIVNRQHTSVIVRGGIVSEKTIVTTQDLPSYELAIPTIAFDAGTRSITLSVKEDSHFKSCKVDIFEKATDANGQSQDIGSAFTLTYILEKSTAHTLTGRFRCVDENGKIALSAWSASVTIPAASATSTVPAVETPIVVNVANEGSDSIINKNEKNSSNPIWAVPEETGTLAFTLALSASGLSCNASQSYDQSHIPTAGDLTSDGTYSVCVRAGDSAGNFRYAKAPSISRDTVEPIFTALSGLNAGSDSFVNDAEKLLPSPLWTLSSLGHASLRYTAALSDPGNSLICDSSQNYAEEQIASAASLSSDGSYVICVELKDTAGNLSFGKSDPMVRDTQGPTFTSLTRLNEGSDGIITNAEKNSNAELFSLTASGHSAATYSLMQNDAGGSLVCDGSKTYSASTIPKINEMTADGTYAVCVKLQDSALNAVYGKSQNVLRSTSGPAISVNTLNTSDPTPALSGSIGDPVATLSLSVAGQTYTPTNNGNGTWSLADNTLPILASGTYEVSVTATDALNNTSSDSTSAELTVAASEFISTWTTDNVGVTGNESIKLPLQSNGTYHFLVQWGDGTDDIITQYNDAATTHTYATAGTYEVRISNVIRGWQFADAGDKLKMVGISKWGPFHPGTDGRTFEGAANLTITATDAPNLSGVTSFYRMFRNCEALGNVPNIGQWNTSQITTMEGMFQNAYSFDATIGTWNVSSVTNMANMFDQAFALTADLNSWNVSSVTNMASMFASAYNFRGPIANWNVGSVTNFSRMFFDTLYGEDLSGWDVHSATDMSHMFQQAPSFMSDLNGWDVSNVVNMKAMFQDATAFNGAIGAWDVSSVVNMESMFQGATGFNHAIGSWNTSSVTNMKSLFQGATSFNQTLNWTVSAVTDMSMMFLDATSFNQSLNSWNVGQVTNMQQMFYGAVAFDQPLASWNTGNVLNMDRMFRGANTFNQDLSTWDVSKVTTMYGMFQLATAFNGLLGAWDTGAVTTMVSMFESATSFNRPIDNWDVSAVTDMSQMFHSAIAFNQDLNSWNVSNVTLMVEMFDAATAFNGNISNWTPMAVLSTAGMFKSASAFNSNIGGWTFSVLQNTNDMFRDAAVFNADISNWNVSTVTEMTYMFAGALAFNSPLTNWVTSSVTNMATMFYGASSFNQPVDFLDVSNVLNMYFMFMNASSFDQSLAAWTPGSVTTMNGFLDGVTLSTANYDALLVSWGAQTLQPGITFSAGSSMYSIGSAAAARTVLTNAGWTITDGGPAP